MEVTTGLLGHARSGERESPVYTRHRLKQKAEEKANGGLILWEVSYNLGY